VWLSIPCSPWLSDWFFIFLLWDDLPFIEFPGLFYLFIPLIFWFSHQKLWLNLWAIVLWAPSSSILKSLTKQAVHYESCSTHQFVVCWLLFFNPTVFEALWPCHKPSCTYFIEDHTIVFSFLAGHFYIRAILWNQPGNFPILQFDFQAFIFKTGRIWLPHLCLQWSF